MFSSLRNQLTVFMVCAFAGLSGCAAESKVPEPQGYLATHIYENGSKQFVYTTDLQNLINLDKEGKAGGRPGNVAGQLNGSSNGGLSGGVTAGTANRRPGGHSGRPMQSRDQMLVNAVEKELEKSGFCREGFKELDRMTEPQQTYLKGECIESANAHDRTQFPNV